MTRTLLALATLCACASQGVGTPERFLDSGVPDASVSVDASDSGHDVTTPDTADGDTPAPDRAYLHADVWSVWWNDRTRCGAEAAFLHMCEQRGDDCAIYREAVANCDPSHVVYGQVGPEKSGERLCNRGRHPDIGGCEARRFDFERLQFWWYGAEWAGNWPVATLKVFEGRVGNPADALGDGMVALSNVPGAAQGAMSGIANHGWEGRSGCALTSMTGDAAYQTPFGAFAWIEVPVDREVTVAAMAASNFADRGFDGCGRGAATQSPWITDAPGAVLGCVYVETRRFEPGHWHWHHGRIERVETLPDEVRAGFELAGRDVRAGCVP